MPSSFFPTGEIWEEIYRSILERLHPFSRIFFAPNDQLITELDGRLRLPRGGFTSQDQTLLLTDGTTELDSRHLEIASASFFVNLDLVLLDDLFVLGPMYYQIGISRNVNLELLKRVVDWVAACDTGQLVRILAVNCNLDVCETSRIEGYLPSTVQDENAYWKEKLLSGLEHYTEQCLAKGDREARLLAEKLTGKTGDDLAEVWFAGSEPRVSPFVDLRLFEGLSQTEFVADADILELLISQITA